MRIFLRQRLKHVERGLRAPGAPMRRAQNEPRHGVARTDIEYLARLFRGELGVLLEQPSGMRERDVHRPEGLRDAHQLCTLCIP